MLMLDRVLCKSGGVDCCIGSATLLEGIIKKRLGAGLHGRALILLCVGDGSASVRLAGALGDCGWSVLMSV